MSTVVDEKQGLADPVTSAELDPLAGLHIIDCDAHFTEPPDLWSARVSKSMQHTVPQMRTIDGVSAWYLGDDRWANTGGNTITHSERKILGAHTMQPFEAIDPCSWDVDARLALM